MSINLSHWINPNHPSTLIIHSHPIYMWNGRSKKRSKNETKSGPQSKKAKTEDDIEDKLKVNIMPNEIQLWNSLKEQNHTIWTLRDQLNKEVSKNALVSLLQYNEQYIPKGESNLLDSLVDCMLFGCLSPCPECNGLLTYSCSGYACRSMINEWVKCVYRSREVSRSAFIVPDEYLDVDVLYVCLLVFSTLFLGLRRCSSLAKMGMVFF